MFTALNTIIMAMFIKLLLFGWTVLVVRFYFSIDEPIKRLSSIVLIYGVIAIVVIVVRTLNSIIER